MLTPSFDSKSKVPLYEQLYRFLRQEIESGGLAADERLPSKRSLAMDARLSVVTVETAYSQLVAEGYIRSENRRGFFVQKAAARPEQSAAVPPQPAPLPEVRQTECRYDFATNAVDAEFFPFSTWAKLTRAVLSRKDSTLLSAAHPQGVPELRQAIVNHLYHFRGIRVQPEQVVVGAGSEYLISLVVQLLGREGSYAVEDPGYPKTEQILSHNGANVLPIPVDQQGLRVDLLEPSGARVVHVTPSHHFPLSQVMPVSRRSALLDWAAEQPDRYIIEDDYDSEFRLSGRPIPALQGMDRQEALQLLKSLKADNVTVKQGAQLAEMSFQPLPKDRYGLKKIMSGMKPELFRDLLYVKLASSLTPDYKEACAGEDLHEVISVFEDIMEMGEPVYLSDLVLTGNDLITLGAAEGPEIGETLHRMLDAVWKDPQINTIMYLISNFYRM